jgi:hypothetical protein
MIPELLRSRAHRWFCRLCNELTDLTNEQALAGSRADWPRHAYGIGQNGSIAGIIYHVAAWKTMTLPALTGGTMIPLQEFDESQAPEATDWPGIRTWLEEIGQRWNEALDSLPDERFDESLSWEGRSILMTAFLLEMIDHDVQHSSQIEYIKQLQRAMNGAKV